MAQLIKNSLGPEQLAETDQLVKLIQKHNALVNARRYEDANALIDKAERINPSHFITRTMLATSTVIAHHLAED